MSSSTRTSSFRTAHTGLGSQSSHASASRTAAGAMNTSSSLSTSLHHHPQPHQTSPPLSLSFYNNSNNPVIHGDDATTKKKNVLNRNAVRERSLSIPGCKEINVDSNGSSTTVTFLVVAANNPTVSSSDGKQNQPARITIFCDTGTIGTARVLDGKVRQTFRRNVNSLDVVERLLTFPEGPIEIDENLIGIHDDEIDNNLHSISDENKEPTNINIDYQKEVELADVGLCILEGEREKLTKHLRHLEVEEEEEEEKMQQQVLKYHQKQQKQLQQEEASGSVASGQLQSQSQLLQQATNTSFSSRSNSGTSNNNDNINNSSSSNSNRTGRRRNKLLKLSSKNRNSYGSDHNSKTAVVISKTDESRKRNTTFTTVGAAISTSSTRKKYNKINMSNNGTHEENVRSAYASAVKTITKSDDNGNDYDNVYSSSSSSNNKSHQRSGSGDVNEISAYEFDFKLPADVMKQVDQCLRDIAKMNKVVKGVATNGRGTVFLYGNGGVAYTPSIPKALYHKLRQLRSSSYSSRPCFVALGTRDRYYVAFNDGTADWKGSNLLDKMLKKIVMKNNNDNYNNASDNTGGTSKPNNTSLLPRSVAFGSTYDTSFIIYSDGSWQYKGRGIPKSLEEKLTERQNKADLLYCNLGPSGEWFLKAENGKMWWSGITHALDIVLKRIISTGYLHNIDFGENGSYFISYDEKEKKRKKGKENNS